MIREPKPLRPRVVNIKQRLNKTITEIMPAWQPSSPLTTMTPEWERRLTNLFLVTLITIFVLDSWPSQTWDTPRGRIHKIQEWMDPFVDVTGLWQGPWYLFCPTPPTENVYVSAQLYYQLPPESTSNSSHSNIAMRTWTSPRWSTQWTTAQQVLEKGNEQQHQQTKNGWSPIQIDARDVPSLGSSHKYPPLNPIQHQYWVTSVWERKRLFRVQEFVDAVRNNDNSAVWPSLAEHLAKTHPLWIPTNTTLTVVAVHPTFVQLYRHWQDTSSVVVPKPNLEGWRKWWWGAKVEAPYQRDFQQYQFYTWKAFQDHNRGGTTTSASSPARDEL